MINRLSGTVSVICTTTRTVVSTIPVGGGAAGVAVNRDGTRLYATQTSSNMVSVISTATGQVTGRACRTAPPAWPSSSAPRNGRLPGSGAAQPGRAARTRLRIASRLTCSARAVSPGSSLTGFSTLSSVRNSRGRTVRPSRSSASAALSVRPSW